VLNGYGIQFYEQTPGSAETATLARRPEAESMIYVHYMV
jgi:hypothetical protein